jgi:hypothetical protein
MADHTAAKSGLNLSNGFYDVLRQFVEKVFPGLGVLYAALATLWGWGYIAEVGGSFAALSVFGALLLSLSRKAYQANDGAYDGAVVGDVVDGQAVLRVELDPSASENLLNKSQLLIKGFDPSA